MCTSLRGLQVCVLINITVRATLSRRGVFPRAGDTCDGCLRGCCGGCREADLGWSAAGLGAVGGVGGLYDGAVPAVDRLSPISPAQAAEIALRQYGVGGTAERLASEHDDTFRLAGADGVARLLKISVAPAAAESPGLQTALLLHLARVAPELPVQRVITTLDGQSE